MADSVMGGMGQITGEVGETVKEVAVDVKDAVGEAIEQGVKSVVGTPLTPQQIQQKQQEDQKKLAETRRKIDWLKNVDQEQRRVQQENKQKEAQRLQNQNQEEKVKEIKLEQKKQQKKTPPGLEFAGKMEKKGGVGG